MKDSKTGQPVALVGFLVVDTVAGPFAQLALQQENISRSQRKVHEKDHTDDDSWLRARSTEEVLENLRKIQLKNLLPAYAIPAALVALKQMPMRVGMGKLDKKKLLELVPKWIKAAAEKNGDDTTKEEHQHAGTHDISSPSGELPLWQVQRRRY